ncbi:hypothetical protein SBA1_110020 [Candidatus Sulfotelmatobacter kueseliae]|uniref:Uncharacterized protein n=1 Tax=Candidatus Sulfotelmatobacter kueseliae TaxID=2042962 RepID=A0A2U3JZH3_9BACT|nr:hypothetical protein SBA1_110020 [Candidatus Sulfotelmatobacter kueseliae]
MQDTGGALIVPMKGTKWHAALLVVKTLLSRYHACDSLAAFCGESCEEKSGGGSGWKPRRFYR